MSNPIVSENPQDVKPEYVIELEDTLIRVIYHPYGKGAWRPYHVITKSYDYDQPGRVSNVLISLGSVPTGPMSPEALKEHTRVLQEVIRYAKRLDKLILDRDDFSRVFVYEPAGNIALSVPTHTSVYFPVNQTTVTDDRKPEGGRR